MSGGTFTISSLGGIGGTSFTPIINAPEVAILGVTRSAMKPVWNGARVRAAADGAAVAVLRPPRDRRRRRRAVRRPPRRRAVAISAGRCCEPTEVRVPDIGDFTDVPVIEILVAPGDEVAVEDPLVTLESDKATMDVPAPGGGRRQAAAGEDRRPGVGGQRAADVESTGAAPSQRPARPEAAGDPVPERRATHPRRRCEREPAPPPPARRRRRRRPRRPGRRARLGPRRLHGRVPRRRPRPEDDPDRALRARSAASA